MWLKVTGIFCEEFAGRGCCGSSEWEDVVIVMAAAGEEEEEEEEEKEKEKEKEATKYEVVRMIL